jgi:membrane associated rhomboid family serine protease
MGLYERDYTQEQHDSEHGFRPYLRMFLPQLTPVVRWLLIANIAVFLIGYLAVPIGDFLLRWFSVYPISIGTSLQLWRLVTYQFLHGSLGHVFWNMFVLYFFGPMLERFWGSRKYLVFYLVCGAMGGVFYPILAHIGWLDVGPLMGASGSILGMLAAAAILFPHMIVYVFGVFPMKMSLLAIILAVMSVLSVLRPEVSGNAGGEAAHLGGMIAGALYVLSENWRRRLKLKIRGSAWEKRLAAERNLQAEVDRILQKLHDHGIHSLTAKEKRILHRATKYERTRTR